MTDANRFAHPRLLGDTTLVRRSSCDLQVGLDDDAIVLESVPPAAEAVLRRLDGRHTVAELGRVIGDGWVGWILDSLAREGRLAEGPYATSAMTVRVIGSGSLAAAVARALLESDAQVRLADPMGESPVRLRQLLAMLSSGRPPRRQPVIEGERDLRADTVSMTVVAGDTAEPDRALTGLLTRSGIPHLLVRNQPARALVGPFFIPGRTACLRCGDLARAAADPAWPVIAYELSRLRSTRVDPLDGWAVSLAVAHLKAYHAGGSPETLAGTLELGDDGVTRFRRWPRHPACDCRAHDLSSGAARMGA